MCYSVIHIETMENAEYRTTLPSDLSACCMHNIIYTKTCSRVLCALHHNPRTRRKTPRVLAYTKKTPNKMQTVKCVSRQRTRHRHQLYGIINIAKPRQQTRRENRQQSAAAAACAIFIS